MLTIIAIRNAKPKEKLYRLFDERGLYLEVMPNGSKYWRLKYRFNGKDKRLALGVFPEVSLAVARDKRDTARKLVAEGTDPSFARKEAKRQRVLRSIHTFESVARAWHKDHQVRWDAHYSANIIRKFELDIFPHIGNRPVAEITPLELLEAIKKIEKRGAYEVARRCLRLCGQVYKYAIPNGLAERNPAADLTGALTPYKKTHFAALDIKELPGSLQALECNDARLAEHYYISIEDRKNLIERVNAHTKELITIHNAYDFSAKNIGNISFVDSLEFMAQQVIQELERTTLTGKAGKNVHTIRFIRILALHNKMMCGETLNSVLKTAALAIYGIEYSDSDISNLLNRS